MGRKVLQDIVNTLPQMVVGWRMYEDLERLADHPTTQISINLLRQTAIRDGVNSIDLQIVDELAEWSQRGWRVKSSDVRISRKWLYMSTSSLTASPQTESESFSSTSGVDA